MADKDFFEKVGDTVYKAAEATGQVARQVADTAKLNYDNARLRDSIRKAFQEIGKKYFEEIKDAPGEEYMIEVGTILSARKTIEENKEKIEELKRKPADED